MVIIIMEKHLIANKKDKQLKIKYGKIPAGSLALY